MDNKVVFNPNDWDSVQDLINSIIRVGSLQFGEDEEGNPITADVSQDNCLVVKTLQHNGWTRVNTYYPDDHIREETYER